MRLATALRHMSTRELLARLGERNRGNTQLRLLFHFLPPSGRIRESESSYFRGDLLTRSDLIPDVYLRNVTNAEERRGAQMTPRWGWRDEKSSLVVQG